MRAARALWARLVRQFDPQNPKSLSLRTHSQTSGWSLTAQDVFNNVQRTCIEAMAATQGHTQSLHTNALDEAIALPTDFSARIARNTQLLLQQESGTTGTIDPWGGSYYVERLTHDLAERAWAHILEAEQAGGMAKAIEQGIPKMRIEEAAARTQARIDSGKQKVIGVNTYRLADEDPLDVLKVDNSEVYRQQIAKLERLRAERDDDEVQPHARRADQVGRRRPRPRLLARPEPAHPRRRRGPRQGHGRRDLRRAGEGVRAAPGRDPYHQRRVQGRVRLRRRPARAAGHRGGRQVRGGRGPPAAHPGREDGPGRPRPRPEGRRQRLRRHGLRRRRRAAVLHARRGRPAGDRRRRAHRRGLLAGRRPPHPAPRAAQGARRARPPGHHGRDRRRDPARRRTDAQGDGRRRGVPARHRHRRVRPRPAREAVGAARATDGRRRRALAAGIRDGNRATVSRAITLVESSKPAHRAAARELLARARRRAGLAGRAGRHLRRPRRREVDVHRGARHAG